MDGRHNAIKRRNQLGSVEPRTVTILLGSGIFLLIMLALFDAHHWHSNKTFKGTGNFFQLFAGSAAVGLFVVGTLTAVERYPSYPLAVVVASFPLLAFMLKRCLLNEMCNCGDERDGA